MEGYCSIEEQLKDYIELFFGLLPHGHDGAEEPDGAEGPALREKSISDYYKKKKCIYEKELASGIFLPSVCLRHSCRLPEEEYMLVMLAAAFELEDGLCMDFRKCFGAEWPDLRYALIVLSRVENIDFTLLAAVSDRKNILSCIFGMSAPHCRTKGLLLTPFVLSCTVFNYITTGAFPKEDWFEIFPALPGDDVLKLNEEQYILLQKYTCQEPCGNILIKGRKGSGRHTLVRRLCAAAGKAGFLINAAAIADKDTDVRAGIYGDIRVIRYLLEPVTAVALEGTKEGGRRDELRELIREGGIVFMAEEDDEAGFARRYADFEIDMREYLMQNEKKEFLDKYIAEEYRQGWQDRLFAGYSLNAGEMKRRLKKALAYIGMYGGRADDEELWHRAVRMEETGHAFGTLVKSTYSPEDLVLPQECKKQLEILLLIAKSRMEDRKYSDAYMESHRGLRILFHGSSGTGKTMAASVLAAQLGLTLFKVDLSQIVDKYIGETEKHIEELFRTAERNNYIIFFDEADALFSKRTEIQDSNDRYANISTAYLLQRIESCGGIVILATNLLKHFDEAFMRRIDYIVKFRNLEENDRIRLWEKLLEGTPPAAGDVVPEALAKAAKLSPARIRSVVHTARMLAAGEESEYLRKKHIADALYLEANKDETAVGRID